MRLIIAFIAALALTGCASSPLDLVSGLVGSKPDMSAQVGAENTKQGVGLSNKVDASNEVKNELKNSKVDSLDTSSGKKVSASSISADVIKADKIEIRNSDGISAWWLIFALVSVISIGVLAYFRKAKAPN